MGKLKRVRAEQKRGKYVSMDNEAHKFIYLIMCYKIRLLFIIFFY